MTAAERFHRLRVDDVMVPRADIVAIDSTSTLTELSKAFKDAGHSRLPVYKETLDDPTGMVHIKDLLPYLMLDAKGKAAVFIWPLLSMNMAERTASSPLKI